MKKTRHLLAVATLILFVSSCDINSFDEINQEQIQAEEYEEGFTEDDDGEDDKPSGNPVSN
ncbi:MAG: hypothetical protein WBA74_00400 [Cyclobacteriaceae bacterium]